VSTNDVILAIETSQRTGSVAVRRSDASVDCETLRTTTRHEDDLLPAIDRLLKRNRISRAELSAVGVSIGPGGFTGLRIAVATAKLLAEVLGVQIVAVPSALVAAEPRDEPGPMAVALACKRGWFWLTRLVRDADNDGPWRIDGKPEMTDAAQADVRDVRVLLADRHLPDAMRDRCDREGVALIEPTFAATACLAVAHRMLRRGETVDPLSLAPLYARQPEAVRLWRSRHEERPERQS